MNHQVTALDVDVPFGCQNPDRKLTIYMPCLSIQVDFKLYRNSSINLGHSDMCDKKVAEFCRKYELFF